MSAQNPFTQAVETSEDISSLREHLERMVRFNIGSPIYRYLPRTEIDKEDNGSEYESKNQIELVGASFETGQKDAYGFDIYLLIGVDGTAAAVAGRDAHDNPSLARQLGEFGQGYNLNSPSVLAKYQTFADQVESDISYMAHVLYTSITKPIQIEKLIDVVMPLAQQRLHQRLQDRERIFRKITSAFEGLF